MSQPEKQVKWRSLIAEQKESGQSVAAFCLDGACVKHFITTGKNSCKK